MNDAAKVSVPFKAVHPRLRKMTLLDFYAAHALQGMLANPHWVISLEKSVGNHAPAALAEIAMQHAKLMLELRTRDIQREKATGE